MTENHRDPLSDDVKKKLRGIGFTAREYTRARLLAAFPPAFNAGSLDLDLESLAKVLIHLSERGIIRLKPRPEKPTSTRK